MVERGSISHDAYDVMRRAIPGRPGSTYYDAFDEMMARRGTDMNAAIADFQRFVVGIEGQPVSRSAVGNVWRAVMSLPRGISQYNIFNAHGIIGDATQDGLRMVGEGHGAAFVEATNPVNWIKAASGREDQLSEYLRLTETVDPNVEGLAHRTEFASGEQTPIVKAAMKVTRGHGELAAQILTEPFDSRLLRKTRNAMDVLRRRAVFLSQVQQEYGQRQARWLAESNAILDRAGLASDAFDGLPDLFSVRQTREAALAAGADEKTANRIARNWKAELNAMRTSADAEQKRVLFDFSHRTRADDILSNVFFYHFWMTRAYPAYASMAIRNPAFLALWYRTWMASEQQARTEGLPASFVGRLRYKGTVAGFYESMNPWYTLAPTDPGSLAGMMGGGGHANMAQDIYQKATNIVMLNPAIQMAAAVVGLDDNVPDPLMTYSLRKYAGTIANFGRAHGWWGDQSLGDAPYQQFWTNAVNAGRDALQSLHLPVSSSRLTDDPNAYPMELLAYVARDVVVEKTGVPFDAWKPDDLEYAMWNAANNAIKQQDGSNDVANEAFLRYMNAKGGNDAAALGLPGGSKLTYGPRDRSRASVTAGYGAISSGAEPTPHEQGAMDFKASAQAPAGAAPLISQDQQYGALGTDWSRGLQSGWAALAFDDAASLHGWGGKTGMPVNYLKIGGQWVSVDALAAMPDADRKRIADQWVADRVDPANQQSGAPELAQLRDQQSAFKTTNPTYGAYVDWKSQARKYPGGLDAWIAATRKGNPNYDAYLKAARDPSKAALSLDGYLAYAGQPSNLYAAPTKDVRDMSQVPYGANQSVAGGGRSGSGSVSLSRPDALRKSIADYNDSMATVAPYLPKDKSGNPIDPAGMIPTVRAAFFDALRKQGVTVPSLPAKVSTFYEWKSLQPSGADVSEEAFFAWLDKTQGTSTYDEGLTPAA